MPDYAVFGGRLRSPLPLAGLRPLDPAAAPDWRLRVDPAPPRPAPLPAAVEWDDGGLRIRLFALPGGWRLAYDDTGTYDVLADGAAWTWHPGPGAARELVQADLLGRVLALALAARGALPLHGSAVTCGGEGIVILGPKHAGKSTLAAALAAAGARLVADDMAVADPRYDPDPRADPGPDPDRDPRARLHPDPHPRLLPGVPLLRLWNEAAEHLRAAGLRGTRIHGTKQTLADLPAERVEPGRTPLAAIYVLDPRGEENGPAARRTPLAPTDAVLAMVTHAKLGPLLHGPLAAAHLARAARTAAHVPAYTLRVASGFGRLAEAAARIRDWHSRHARAAA